MALSPRSAPVSDRLRMVTSLADTSSRAYWLGPVLPRLSRAVLPLVGPRICTLSPFTLAQNSLHGSFGMSGDISAVPPKAATIGPAGQQEARIGAPGQARYGGRTTQARQFMEQLSSWMGPDAHLMLGGAAGKKLAIG